MSVAGDAEVKELKAKLDAYVRERFAGDWQSAFAAYDQNGNKQISPGELEQLLSDADVGNFLTRGAWVSGILEQLDKDHNGAVSFPELERVITNRPKPSAPDTRPDYLYPVQYPVQFTPAKANPPKKEPKPPAPSDDSSLLIGLAIVAGLFLVLRARR
jgi:hypothetical protein